MGPFQTGGKSKQIAFQVHKRNAWSLGPLSQISLANLEVRKHDYLL